MSDMTPEQVVDALVPVIERAIGRRMEEVYGTLEQLREEFQQTINVMDGNDQAIVAALQEIRGKISGEGYQVAEVLAKAGESWERFVRAEAEKLGLKVITPKVIQQHKDLLEGKDSVEKIDVREGE